VTKWAGHVILVRKTTYVQEVWKTQEKSTFRRPRDRQDHKTKMDFRGTSCEYTMEIFWVSFGILLEELISSHKIPSIYETRKFFSVGTQSSEPVKAIFCL
jgi:hypothetical protein